MAELENRLRAAARPLVRMPSASELRGIGEGGLANKVARTGGFAVWARRLGLRLKGTETHRGQAWEAREARALRELGASVEWQSTKAPFDLLVNGLRVDVKSAQWTEYRPGDRVVRGYVFAGLRGGKGCDVFDLVCVAGSTLLHRFVVPAEAARVRTLTITPRTLTGAGKYSAFRDRLDLLGIEVRP